MKTFLCITHAAFDERRHAPYQRLLDQLGVVPDFEVHDREAKGSLPPWLRCLRAAAESDATHMVYLPDDAILVPHFMDVVRKLIDAKPAEVICCQSNSETAPKAYEMGARWYTTHDGFTGFGAILPIELVREHLKWRECELREDCKDVAGDLGVNLWCMATGREIYKPLPSLVDHDTSIPSCDGNDGDPSARRPLVWEPDADLRSVEWSGSVAELGRTYKGNQRWLGVMLRAPSAEVIERMYTLERNGPVSDKPHIVICRPAYRETPDVIERTEASLCAVLEDLHAHGIGFTMQRITGDSLVCRMRQRMMHAMLKTAGTHLLWWDADVEALDPTCVRAMLETEYDVVGGAYPAREPTGRVICNVTEEEIRRIDAADKGTPVTFARGCVEVRDAGTGFLLVSRRAHVALMAAHPELRHQSRVNADYGEPLWALYDTGVVDGVYESEDYMFCRRWQAIGGKVYVYVPATFRHYGVHGFEGSIAQQLGVG